MNNNITKGTWQAGSPSISKAVSDKWECLVWSDLDGFKVLVATVYGESKEQVMANAEFIVCAATLNDAEKRIRIGHEIDLLISKMPKT